MQAAVVTLRSRSEVVFGSIIHGNCRSCQVTLGRQNLVVGGKHQKINRKTTKGLNHWELRLSETATFAMSFWCSNLWGFVHREFFEKASVSCETWKMNLELMEPESGRALWASFRIRLLGTSASSDSVLVEQAKLAERSHAPYFALGIVYCSAQTRFIAPGFVTSSFFRVLRRRLTRPSWWEGPVCLISPLASSCSEPHSMNGDKR